MGLAGVYSIRCVVNGKIYFGSSKDIKTRWGDHRSCLNNNRHANPLLQNCWTKHGERAFIFSVVQVVEDEADLLREEQRWLDVHFDNRKRCLNVAPQAGTPMRGRTASAETRQKLSRALKGRVFTAQHRERMKGPKSPEHCESIRAGLTGKKHTEERRANASAAQKKRPVRGTRAETGETVEFASLTEAENNGFLATSIQRCCDGLAKTHKGHHWEDSSPRPLAIRQLRQERYRKREKQRLARARAIYAVKKNDPGFMEHKRAKDRRADKKRSRRGNR